MLPWISIHGRIKGGGEIMPDCRIYNCNFGIILYLFVHFCLEGVL